MEQFLFENKVESMRARDLRNLLMQKLGVEAALVNRILDREELKQMVSAIVYERIQMKAKEEYWALAFKVAIAAGVLTFIFLIRNFIFGFAQSVYEGLGETTYKSTKKAKLLAYNMRKRKYIAAFALAVSLLLELAVLWIQVSILLSWVLSRDHFIRRFMLPTLSFPVSANTLLKATGKKPVAATDNAGISGAMSNFSLDMGPMLTMMALNFLVGKLDNYAAGVVLDHKRAKSEKKAAREYAKYGAPEESALDSTEGSREDNPFTNPLRGGDRNEGPDLRRRRAPTPANDEERIDDSLNRFFGRKEHQPATRSAPPPAEAPESAPSSHPNPYAHAEDCMPELLRHDSPPAYARQGGSAGSASGTYAGTEDGWLD